MGKLLGLSQLDDELELKWSIAAYHELLVRLSRQYTVLDENVQEDVVVRKILSMNVDDCKV